MHTPIPVFRCVPENGREWMTAWSGALRCGWTASLVDRRRTERTSEGTRRSRAPQMESSEQVVIPTQENKGGNPTYPKTKEGRHSKSPDSE